MGTSTLLSVALFAVSQVWAQSGYPMYSGGPGSQSAGYGQPQSPYMGMMGSQPQQQQPMMFADPRMGGGMSGGMGPMMMDPRMSGGAGNGPMMMADPRMSGGPGLMQGGGGFGGASAMTPAMFRSGYPSMMRGMPPQFQQGQGQQPMMMMGGGGQGPSPYGGQMGGQEGPSYPSPYGGDGQMMMGGGGQGGFPMGGGMQGYPGGGEDGGSGMRGGYPTMSGPGSVSFFPFARVRPGPGLVIISTKESGSSNDTSSPANRNPYDLSAFLNNPNPFDISGADNSNDTTSSNGTTGFGDYSDTDTDGTGSVVVVSKNNTTTTAAPVVKLAAVTVATVVAVNGTTTQAPCKSPVYMNKNFMATALQMGLISANTSCVILIDQ